MSSDNAPKFNLWALIALVVGSMVGAGVFSLPATFARASGGLGAIIAWIIAGCGMLMLAFVFQTLAQRKPELDAGIFAYAQDGFGNYMGFASALGFWAGTCVGNVSYFVLIKSTLGAFFPIFGDGNTVPAVLVASVILWGFHIMILRGIKQAAAINTVVTIAKVVPIFIFIVILLFAFNYDTFSANFLGHSVINEAACDLAHLEEYGHLGYASTLIEAGRPDSLLSQIRGTMLVTVFVFIGIEGASVYSRYAKNRKDVGVATVLGFLGVLCTFMLVSLLPFGIMLRPELSALRQPSMAGVLEAVVGRWGMIFISVGLIVSVLGAYLAWTLLCSEVLFIAAKNKSCPAFLTKENAEKVPTTALWLTNIVVQLFLVATLFTTYAFTLALELTSSLSLIPYLLIAAYALKLAWTRETYDNNPAQRKKDFVIALVATVYSALMLYSGGMKYLLLSALIYLPGSILFIVARREQKKQVFTPVEGMIFGVIGVAGVAAIIAIATGAIVV